MRRHGNRGVWDQGMCQAHAGVEIAIPSSCPILSRHVQASEAVMAGTSAVSGDADLGGSSRPELHRTIGPFQMTLYGLGSMLGSGVYGLMGQAAGQVGNAVWLAFLVALVAALLTALTYASLGSRYPRAGGAAYIAERAYRSPLGGFVGGDRE